ncbi:(2Fe-2S)-binding protein [Sphingomonas crocodyli]|uniref:(2Fe-2S)-binding protein n=1 Tax=Sphingomonas crocodyli TaxID=1979270 RepID=A0A437MBR6_9SPHN|nr:(2Fe-2S)-binding protein [Sphingomonas crocodyli]RVT95082.1 (2Fe-2S)-binding protein [Sphingomonas crocodyli]
MFRKLDDRPGTITIEIDGLPVIAEPGESVAAVLLRQPTPWTRRSAVSGAPRAPYCMMGVCFECLAEVDGVASVQTCLVQVADGMRISRQAGKRRIVA